MHFKAPFKAICLLLAFSILITSCASTTMIQSTPSGADVYIDQQKMGVTPYAYTDTKIVGSSTSIILKKLGFKDFNTVLERDEQADVGAIIGGIFVLVPFLWTCKYNPVHSYTLDPANGDQAVPVVNMPASTSPQATDNGDQSAELAKLKALSDNGSLTADEYTMLKGKVLNNTYNYTNSPADQLLKLKSWLDQKLITPEEFSAKKSKVLNGY